MNSIYLAFWVLIVHTTCGLNVAASYWTTEVGGDVSATNVSIVGEVSGASLVTCAALCDRHRASNSCDSFHAVPDDRFVRPSKSLTAVTCYLLMENGDDAPTILSQGTRYRISKCPHQAYPCEMNPCPPNHHCHEVEIPKCRWPSYECTKCAANKSEMSSFDCIKNRLGDNCDVDISGSIYMDGFYFYIPAGDKGGHEMAGNQPNCTDSRRICADRGMRLIIIDSPGKNATVARLGLESEDCYNCIYQMGMHRDMLDDVFQWEVGGTALQLLDFVNWYYGQPSSDTGECLYAAFMPNTFYAWLDITCNFLTYYICEYQLTKDEQEWHDTPAC